MTLDASIQNSVVDAIQAEQGEVLESFNRAFGFACDLEILETKIDHFETAKAGLEAEGLALTMKVGNEGFLFIVLQQTDLLPVWCKNPDASGESRLATLSQELGMTMIPENLMPEDFVADYVESIAVACENVQLAEQFSRIDMNFGADGIQSKAILAWPVKAPMDLRKGPPSSTPAAPDIGVSAPPAWESAPSATANLGNNLDFESNIDRLPDFTRSLLQIQIPMSVKVVSTMKPIGKLLEIGPGSILQFEKNCEEPLILEANNEPIAEGTAVRAGDKFGLQISQILMPRERFWSVQPDKNVG